MNERTQGRAPRRTPSGAQAPAATGRVLITGGTVIGPDTTAPADVLVENGTISAITGPGVLHRGDADETVDADGCWVLPGGVDPHTHLDTLIRGHRTCDDFHRGTVAALAGGTTSVIDFCYPEPGESPLAALHAWQARMLAQRPTADVGAHMVLVQPGEDELAELPRLVAEGVTSIKVYMAYRGRRMTDDRGLLRILQCAAPLGITVLVHAENGDAIDLLTAQAIDRGETAPHHHSHTRPDLLEAEAVNRIAHLGRVAGARVYIVHVSGSTALDPISRSRAAGWDLHGETCPHYLVLDEHALEGDLVSAAQAVCSPPLRRTTDQDALWQALADGVLSTVSSDHCAFRITDQKIMEPRFDCILNGLPGIEQRIMLLHHFGVRTGRITPRRWSDAVSTAPARMFGLYPRKGLIAPGGDADLLVFDPERRRTLTVADHHSAVDHLPYEGIEVVGAPRAVLAGGRTVVRDGRPVPGLTGGGRFLLRAPAEVSAQEPQPVAAAEPGTPAPRTTVHPRFTAPRTPATVRSESV
ncbi:dihydropyrimidinase [Streptomyces sp. RTGN2]|uniref:dihydropyrimidinase n=1 Tax=Streptomyces sp. RTGN2 TaxID=3016525 RepID=UPI0025570F81|nr:dihydropyrimidinase [Streptomyces sp. RTGN2]